MKDAIILIIIMLIICIIIEAAIDLMYVLVIFESE